MSGTISKTSDATVPLSFSAAIEHLCEHIRQGIESCIPAQFVEYDSRDKGLAVVSPLVKFPYVSGNKTVWKERPQFTVRILRVKSGGFWFRMPLKKGDTGWIIAADRDTSFAISRNANVDESQNTKENGGGPQEYSNFNKLKYSFGFFLPDGFCDLKMKDGHEESSFWAMLKDDGSGETDSYIELKKDGDIVLHGSGEWERVLVEGNIGVTGDLETRGTIRAEAGSDDPLEVKDTQFLVPVEDDKYSIWNGRVLRSEGELGEPFTLKGGGGAGKQIEDVTYKWETRDDGTHTIVTIIYTDGTHDEIDVPPGERGPQGPEGEPGPPGRDGESGGGGGGTGEIELNAGSGISIQGEGVGSKFTISAHWV